MRRSQLFELSLALAGLCAAGAAAAPSVRAALIQRRLNTASPAVQAAAGSSAKDGPVVGQAALSDTYLEQANDDIQTSHVIGLLKIPSLKLSAPILSGIGEGDLTQGVGHVPGSGFAGGLGNMAVAGHRDTFFRPLRSVSSGMEVIVTSDTRSYRYRVDRTEIVKPDQLRVLDIGTRPELTMITCYPFNFLGSAPERFVVHAHLVSLDPEQPSR